MRTRWILTTIGLTLFWLLIAATALTFAQEASPAAQEEAVAAGVPSAWVTPLEIDFGPVGVGFSSAVHTVTIRNTGTTTLTNFAGGAPFDPQFKASQNCAGGVAPGASCSYFFRFTPTAVGAFTTTSNSSTNAGDFVITLRGRGVGAGLHVTPLSLDFGRVLSGATGATQVVTIRNTGATTLTNFAGGAPFDPQFSAFQNCASGVAPGGSCQYFFNFSPKQTGVISTSSNSSTNAGAFQIALRGRGTALFFPLFDDKWVTPLDLDFGPVGVGFTSPSQTVYITNTGLFTLTSFAGGAPFDPQFSAFQNCAGGVAPGAGCQYTFFFKPESAGFFTTTSNSSTSAGPIVITLRGQGVGASHSVSPLSLDFGYVPVGNISPPQVVTITNTSPTTLTNFAGGAPFDSQFNATQNCAGGVPPGGSCQYTFTFQPNALGRFTTTSSSSTNGGPIVIQLAGGVAPPTLGMRFEPPIAKVGESVTLRYLLTNTNPYMAATGVAFNNALPIGVKVASPANATASPECNGPTLTAAPGSGSIAMSNAAIIAGETCVVTVKVFAEAAGDFLNALAASSVNGGASNAATATFKAQYVLNLPLIVR
ncbi:choice-of-anchor D domain-containing protein [Caldilinea sp.]|uniref:choice-of-anchor D domain-containing protein n=1 Tax=Caldilinea sp. TaxID=2293560 RepID=UPI00262450EE|nr:choice-of-anchor D domain-containing protein [uncultured Caldilinea sp.]